MPSVVFVGTDSPLQSVLQQRDQYDSIEIAGVYTVSGHNRQIDSICRQAHIRQFDLLTLRREQPVACDWLFSVNSTLILPPQALLRPRCGSMNLHPGRLPDYAGLHTHQWAIRNGEESFAATLHWMEPAVDTGDIAYAQHFPLTPRDTGLSLFMRCWKIGGGLVLRCLADIASGKTPPRQPQDLSHRHLYRARHAQDGRIDWQLSASTIERFIRAADYAPFESPTYQPTTDTRQGRFLVRKAQIDSGRHTAAPGTVLRLDDRGIVLACGNQSRLRVTQVVDHNGRKYRATDIASIGMQPGDHWALRPAA